MRTHSPVVAWVAVVGVAAIAAAGLAVADRPPATGARNTAEALLPPDGTARLLEYADGSRWMIESAHSTGVLFMIQQPALSGSHQLARLDDEGTDASQVRYWRQTFTDAAGERNQLTDLYQLDDDGVRMLTSSGGPNGFSYSPGLLALPASIADGDTWSSSGEALPQGLLMYDSTGSAVEVGEGCFEVTSKTSYTDPAQGGAEVLSSEETSTWCPGEGIVETAFDYGGQKGSATTVALKNGEFTADAEPAVPDFSTYADWESHELELVVTDPIFGESTLVTTTDSTSATTPSGIAVFNTGVDVAAYRVDGARGERAWLARAGGQILWLTTVGEIVLVATTERSLVAYDSHGRRLWSTGFADVLGAVPVPDGDGGLIVQVLNGDLVRLDRADGSELWRTRLADDAEVTPVVADGHVYAADRAGSVYSFDVETGTREWVGSMENPAVLAAGGGRVFVASTDGAVDGWDAATGTRAWTQIVPGIPQQLVVASDRVVVQTNESTIAWDRFGSRQWTVAAVDGLATDGELLLVIGQGQAVIVDGDANQLASWKVEEPDLAIQRRLVLGPTGFWIVGSDFRVLAVGS